MSLTLGTEEIPLTRDASGTIRVGKTRISLESVAYAYQEEPSAAAVQEAYPSLSLSDIHLVLGYCLRHPEELKEYLEEQRRSGSQIRLEMEAVTRGYGSTESLWGQNSVPLNLITDG